MVNTNVEYSIAAHWYFGFILDRNDPNACLCESCKKRRYMMLFGASHNYAVSVSYFISGGK